MILPFNLLLPWHPVSLFMTPPAMDPGSENFVCSVTFPASFTLFHSFALCAITDPSRLSPEVADGAPFRPISVSIVRKYLVAVWAWHIAKGWPLPLSEDDQDHINCGIENIQGNWKCSLCPPITISMLQVICSSLNLEDSLETCFWAMAAGAVWKMMCFSEVSVAKCNTFSGVKYLTHKDAHFGLIWIRNLMYISISHQPKLPNLAKSNLFF